MGRESGQATVELVAALPALLLAGLVSLQLLAVGYALTLADGAAEAGALALATGRPATAAARDALPSWAEDEVEVSVRGGRVAVTVVPPAPLRALAERLAVTSSAAVRPRRDDAVAVVSAMRTQTQPRAPARVGKARRNGEDGP